MARKCKVCGDRMNVRVGEHHGDLGKGTMLYRDVRMYTCPNECGGTFYDFSRAIPANAPIRILGLIKAPKRVLNVVDPLLAIGLVAATILIIAGFLLSMMDWTVKVVAISAVTALAVWLMVFMGSKPNSEENA